MDPATVSQISTYHKEAAHRATDGDLSTRSHTVCSWNSVLWYKMTFNSVYCFSEVVIVQSHLNGYGYRMRGTEVYVVHTAAWGETLCGTVEVRRDWTVAGQTYRIPCHQACGDEIELRVRHDGEFYHQACIHMREIEAYTSGGVEDIG